MFSTSIQSTIIAIIIVQVSVGGRYCLCVSAMHGSVSHISSPRS